MKYANAAPSQPSRGRVAARHAARCIAAKAAVAVGWGLLVPSVGCATNSATSAYTPITGVQVRAADLIAGHGCGEGPDQVFMYAVVVGYAGPDGGSAGTPPIASIVSDCFTDAVFANLPPSASGNQSFLLNVYGFNQAAFSAYMDGGLACLPTAPCPGQDPATVEAAIPVASWTATCTAVQTSGITAIATCTSLQPVAGVDGGTPAADAAAATDTDAADAADAADAMDAADD